MDSVRLGMLKLTSGFIYEIRENQMLDVALVDCLSSVNEDKDFRVDENVILMFWNIVCVPEVSALKKTILEESRRSGLSIHPGATKMYQDLKKMFWCLRMKIDVA